MLGHQEATFDDAVAAVSAAELKAARQRCPNKVNMRRWYQAQAVHCGLEFGPVFQSVHAMQTGNGEAVAQLGVVPLAGADKQTRLMMAETVIMDACVQTVGIFRGVTKPGSVPVSLRRLTCGPKVESLLLGDGPLSFECHLKITAYTGQGIEGEVAAFSSGGEFLWRLEGLALRLAPAANSKVQMYSAPLVCPPVPSMAPDHRMDSLAVHVVAEPGSVLEGLISAALGDCIAHQVSTAREADVILDCRNCPVLASSLLSSQVRQGSRVPLVYVAHPGHDEGRCRHCGSGAPAPVSDNPSLVLGFARSARVENPSMFIYCFSLDERPALNGSAALQELLPTVLNAVESRDEAEPDFEWHWDRDAGYWNVPRVQLVPEEQPVQDWEDRAVGYQLQVDKPGQLASLRWHVMTRLPLEHGEVRVKVRAPQPAPFSLMTSPPA